MGNYQNELNQIMSFFGKDKINREKAFEILALQYIFYKEKDINSIVSNLNDHLTNGTNDGGIDLVYYDEEDEVLSLVQCKTSSISSDEILDEVRKMSTTVEAFKNYNTGAYSSKLKRVLRENLDRLTDNGQIEYHVFYLGNFDIKNFERKLKNSPINHLEDMIKITDIKLLNSQISNIQDTTSKVKEFKGSIDKTGNYLEYESQDNYGVMVNLSSNSVISMYEQFKDKGLFDMNIRKFISHKLVDKGINETLDKDRENFWFYNNGLIIAAEDLSFDGDKITFYDFSIVNGGQTTNRLGEYKGSNKQEFFIPCKIVYQKKSKANSIDQFFTKIAETTNSQKPIKASDLKSNTPEMINLRRDLNLYEIDFQIKRGEKAKSTKFKIKNEEFGQLILSFVMQRPGTARSNKKLMFESASVYASIFKKNYTRTPEKLAFIVDLIDFYSRFKRISDEMKKDDGELEGNAKDILKNGNFILIALIGVLYRLQNQDISSFKEAIDDPNVLNDSVFEYGNFISNYKDDDLDLKIKELIMELTIILEERYNVLLSANTVTSVSNYFKKDSSYHDDILKAVSSKMLLSRTNGPILEYSSFLKRSK